MDGGNCSMRFSVFTIEVVVRAQKDKSLGRMAYPRATATLVAGGVMRVMGAIFEGPSVTGEAVTV